MDTNPRNTDVFRRSSGILLHPTSLPCKYGIGEFGSSIYSFIDLLAANKQKLWQILPLGPTGYGNSPYQCFSAFAGNPLLISIEELLKIGLLSKKDVAIDNPFPKNFVDFGRVIPYKNGILLKAFENFTQKENEFEKDYSSFKSKHKHWLDEFALFMSIKNGHNQVSWIDWPNKLRLREESSLNNWCEMYSSDIEFHKFVQFLFENQWTKVKSYATENGISIIGDIPIFVALDSADVWANPELYHIDESGNPIYVAGVPPDYFSETGQRWGNPIYRWNKMRDNGYKWWIQRIEHTLNYVDIVRIDHFRGFEAYWQIPADEPTAIKGEWVSGPGADLFKKIEEVLGKLPIIAEDLGVITPEVEAIRDEFGFPGMKIMQYAFAQQRHSRNQYLPHNYSANSVVYTGTHDNNTSLGWFKSASQQTKDFLSDYINTPLTNEHGAVDTLIKLAWSSVANFALIPLQDLLKLDESARMNLPGTASGNWEWRFTWDQIKPEFTQTISKMTSLYGRS
ncbi:MAG: 4-alpha-glucanotransferase [Candidatus Kariarchaeaceae archaeon]|jgi:4-alpha-glucanotransferase